MKTLDRTAVRIAALATGLLLAAFTLAMPAHAHQCKGRGTITIKEVQNPHTLKMEYYYIQRGKVCGRLES